MTSIEADHDHIMRDAVAFVRRVAIRLPPDNNAPERNASDGNEVVVGIRADERISLYFGAERSYQFDAENRLRRAFLDGLLYRSEGQTLAELTRVRRPGESTLQSRRLAAAELDAFFHAFGARLARLRAALDLEPPPVVRTVGPAESIIPCVRQRIDAILARPGVLSPAINANR